MKTFFTVVEKHSRQNLGVNIFTDEKCDFHKNREEFVFDTGKSRLVPLCIPKVEEPIRDTVHSLDRIEYEIEEDLPQHAEVMERIEVSPENETINRQLFFMINIMKHHLKGKSSSRSNKHIKMNVSKKFKYYNQTIQNMFLNNKIKETIKEIFCKSQRTYHAFLRFAQRIRIKQAKMNITTDLSMTPIEPNQKNTTIIYQNNTKYPFTLSDLINIVLTSITNAPSLFPEPLVPKNPYNNIPFSKAILYHIYWAIKSSNILIPPLINSYFWSNFNLNDFIVNNEQAVRDYAIKKYVMNSPVTVLYDEIIQMLEDSNSLFRNKTINIDFDFPKNKLVEIMKPYLFLYIMKNDGISGTEKRRVSKIIFKREIINFIKYNPSFGRKIIKCKKTTSGVFKACLFNVSQPIVSLVPSLSCPQCIPLQSSDGQRSFASHFAPPAAMQNLQQLNQDFGRGAFTPPTMRSNNSVGDLRSPEEFGTNDLHAEPLSTAGAVEHTTKDVKTFEFNTANPGLSIKEIEKMYKNYINITPKNINEYDSENGNDSDSESDDSIESYTSIESAGISLERGLGTRIHGDVMTNIIFENGEEVIEEVIEEEAGPN